MTTTTKAEAKAAEVDDGQPAELPPWTPGRVAAVVLEAVALVALVALAVSLIRP